MSLASYTRVPPWTFAKKIEGDHVVVVVVVICSPRESNKSFVSTLTSSP